MKKKNCSWIAEERKILNFEKFRRAQNLLTGLGNHRFKQQREIQLVVTVKNNKEPNQKLTEIVIGKWVQ